MLLVARQMSCHFAPIGNDTQRAGSSREERRPARPPASLSDFRIILIHREVRNRNPAYDRQAVLRAAPMSMFIPPTERGRPNTAENKPRAAP